MKLDNIKKLRLLNGYSQQEMAKLLGISYYSYNKKEKGEHKWRLDEVKKMRLVFNLSPEDIVQYFFS